MHDTLAQLAVDFGISVGTAHAYPAAVIDLLASRAPGLLRALREADPDYVLLDGTLAECVVVTDPAGRLLWISLALPGRAHGLTAHASIGSSGSASARVFRCSPTAPTWVLARG